MPKRYKPLKHHLTPIDEAKDCDYEEIVFLTRELLSCCSDRLRSAVTEIIVPRTATNRERALVKWHIYLAVLAADFADGAAFLVESNRARPMQTLNRSIFEYLTKAKYFAKYPKDAHDQFKSMDARMFTELLRLDHPDESTTNDLKSRFDALRNSNSAINEHSGAKKFAKMYLALADSAEIRTDPQNPGFQYTTTFQINYGVPSLIAHGDAVMMEDVLPHVRSRDNFDIKFDSGTADTLQELQRAVTYIWNFILHIARVFHTEWRDVEQLVNRGATLINLDLRRKRRLGRENVPLHDLRLTNIGNNGTNDTT